MMVLSTLSNGSPGANLPGQVAALSWAWAPWMSLPDWRDQEAANETILRKMNEWTEEVADAPRLGTGGHPMETTLCECSDRTCAEPINLTRPEYESIRSVSVRSAIADTVAILRRTGPVGVVLVIAGFLAGPGEVSIFK
jgi:hypothetical protein